MITVSDSVICRKVVEKFGIDIQQIVAMEELGGTNTSHLQNCKMGVQSIRRCRNSIRVYR